MMLRGVPRFLPLGLRKGLAPALRPLHSTGARLAEEAAAAPATGMKFNFSMPDKTLYEEANVEMVIVPGVDGFFGITPGHVPTIAELKPGMVSVQEVANGPLKKYFVAGGFATIDSESLCNVSTLVAVDIEDLDADTVKIGLAQYQEAYAKATDDSEKSEAEIGVDCYQAMAYALEDAGK
jgi:F-type H+-transporting ATPase subunit delta